MDYTHLATSWNLEYLMVFMTLKSIIGYFILLGLEKYLLLVYLSVKSYMVLISIVVLHLSSTCLCLSPRAQDPFMLLWDPIITIVQFCGTLNYADLTMK